MKKIVTAKEMKRLDADTIEKMGVLSLVLMERAALKTAEEIRKHMTDEEREKILVVCGSGNNGGDGIAIARILHLQGIAASFFLLGSEDKMTQETRRQLEIARNYGVSEVNKLQADEYTTIVDAIFGVGLTRPIEGRYKDVIKEMNRAAAWKVAVDIPSGVDADTGQELGIAFRADLTVTFAFRKRGCCFYPGRMYAGKTIVADIGIYQSAGQQELVSCLEKKDLFLLPKRIPYGNKGTFGKVLMVTGSPGMCGAAYLSAAAALKSGAGMVKIQTVEENRIPLQTLLPEAMVTCEFDEEQDQAVLNWCDVLVIGPGLGTSKKSWERAQWFLKNASICQKPVVLDADGLNFLAMHEEWKAFLTERVIITPHLGEMSRLCKENIGEIQKHLIQTAVSYAKETGAVCVLKDACTVIADASGETYLNLSGNDGMATAGSGDVLSGVMAGILCMFLSSDKKLSPSLTAAFGVYIHGLAGDQAAKTAGRCGLTATDLICALPEILKIVEMPGLSK